MPPISSDALVLRTNKLGETSKVVVLLTRERGKVRAVAKGARGSRHRYHSALEPLSEVRVGLYGRHGADLYRLGQCELIRSAYVYGGRDLETALTFSYYAELLDAFSPEGEADEKAYRLAVAVLQSVEQGASSMVMARYLEAWLLRLHGLYPPLDRCVSCGSKMGEGGREYQRSARGFVCGRCGVASGLSLSAESRRFLDQVFREPPSALRSASVPAEIEPFHQELIARHLERDLRSYRVLRDALRTATS
ncbi:MAG: DNA repair protein RecO [Vicinamibacteria bacterium]|nr:DNA repair protein RecO [Vicinamibacteria bacterium]